jgi:SAM-dependent methyltransferase
MTDTQTLSTLSTPTDLVEVAAEAPAETVAFALEYADPARYDFEYGTSGVDLPFYLALAADASGAQASTARVLDVATGTGRVALALAEAGHTITAVDINAGMLEVAAEKSDARDLTEQITWIEQDARELKVRGKFDLAIVAGNALQQFTTNADRLAVLKAIYRQLNAGGRLAFAVRFPHAAELAHRAETPVIWHSYADASGSQVVVSGTQRYDAATQLMTHETYRQYAVDGSPASAPTTTTLRYALPQELVAALESARFEIESVNADFAGTPLTAQSAASASALVFVARKPQKQASSDAS